MIYTGNDTRWLETVQSFNVSAYRLEQQPAYPADIRAGALDRWLAGDTTPPEPNAWTKFVADKTAEGAKIERVRVVEEPLTPYQEWNQMYSIRHVEAGERQHYLPRSEADEAGITVGDDLDFWLLDGATLVVFTFDDDGARTVEVTTDPARIRLAALRWDVACEAVSILA